MANNYDFSDSNITFLPESARGSLRDQIASQTDENLGRRRVYLNSEEWQEYQSFKNNKMFEHLTSDYPKENLAVKTENLNVLNKPYTTPKSYSDIEKIDLLEPNNLLIIEGLFTSVEEQEHNKNLIQRYNDKNKIENDTADFSMLKWGKELTFAPFQAFDGTKTYICYETARIPLKNENTIKIVKDENGNYSYFTLDKDNQVINSSLNMPKEEVAYLLKLNANDIKKKQENISSNTHSHDYPNLENFDTIKLNDRIKISGISASGELVSHEEIAYKQSLIDKFNKENIVENHTDDFSKIKWGKKLVYDRERSAFDASQAYICVESADFPLVGGLTINITKQGKGYIYSLLDTDRESINSFYTENAQALAKKLKANGRLIKKENENSEQRASHAGRNEIADEPISMLLERIKRRQQEFLEEKEGIAPKIDNSKKFTPTTISKETMDAYVANQIKQNH